MNPGLDFDCVAILGFGTLVNLGFDSFEDLGLDFDRLANPAHDCDNLVKPGPGSGCSVIHCLDFVSLVIHSLGFGLLENFDFDFGCYINLGFGCPGFDFGSLGNLGFRSFANPSVGSGSAVGLDSCFGFDWLGLGFGSRETAA